MRPAALLALAAILAGCTFPPEDAPTPAARDAPPAPAATAQPLVPLVPEPAPRAPALPVSVSLDEAWIKPLRTTTGTLVAPPDARVAWFVSLEEEDPRVAMVGGKAFALKRSTPDRDGTLVRRSPAQLPDLAPDGRPRALRFDAAGQYALEAGAARLAVNVWPGAPAGGATQTFLVEDAAGARFVPDTLDVAPGARVLFWSAARASVDVRERAFAAYVPLEGARVAVTAVDEGLYRLRALVLDARGARGEAVAPFLVDFERPSDTLAPGTWTFDSTAPGIDPPAELSFDAAHPLRHLEVRFVARSNAPAPPVVEVALLRGGETLASATSDAATSLRVEDLPAGEYVVRVTHREGVLASTKVEIDGRYRLPPPERLVAAVSGAPA